MEKKKKSKGSKKKSSKKDTKFPAPPKISENAYPSPSDAEKQKMKELKKLLLSTTKQQEEEEKEGDESELTIETLTNSHIEKYSDDLTLLRFIRARKTVEESAKIFKEMTVWMENKKPSEIKLKSVEKELKTGKCFLHGFDKKGRPCIIVRASKHDPSTRVLEETLDMTIFIIEQSIKLMKKTNASQYVILYDRTEYTRKNFDLDWMKAVANLANVYPERLGNIYILHANTLFHVLFKIVKAFWDGDTVAKTIILKNKDWESELLEHFDADQLLPEHGGKSEWKFDPENLEHF